MPDLTDSIPQDAQATLERLLHKRLYVIVMRPVRPLDEELSAQIGAMLPAHFAWVFEQERNGRLFAAGPLLADDERTNTGEGMFVIRAASLDEARAIADDEPMIAAGLRTPELRVWDLNEGSISIRVTYSDGTFSID